MASCRLENAPGRIGWVGVYILCLWTILSFSLINLICLAHDNSTHSRSNNVNSVAMSYIIAHSPKKMDCRAKLLNASIDYRKSERTRRLYFIRFIKVLGSRARDETEHTENDIQVCNSAFMLAAR